MIPGRYIWNLETGAVIQFDVQDDLTVTHGMIRYTATGPDVPFLPTDKTVQLLTSSYKWYDNMGDWREYTLGLRPYGSSLTRQVAVSQTAPNGDYARIVTLSGNRTNALWNIPPSSSAATPAPA
jgi:hypothetical protein